MKKGIFITLFLTLISISMVAQPPQDEGPGGRGGMNGRGPGGSPQSAKLDANEDYWVENLSVVEGLTLDQKNKLSDLLVKEQRDITKQLEKKRIYQMSFEKDKNLSEKEIAKRLKQMDKVDENIEKIKGKTNKKIVKLFSESQYRIFVEKRNEIKLRRKGIPKGDKQGDRLQRDRMPDTPPPSGMEDNFMEGSFN